MLYAAMADAACLETPPRYQLYEQLHRVTQQKVKKRPSNNNNNNNNNYNRLYLAYLFLLVISRMHLLLLRIWQPVLLSGQMMASLLQFQKYYNTEMSSKRAV